MKGTNRAIFSHYEEEAFFETCDVAFYIAFPEKHSELEISFITKIRHLNE
jgi:hypothetical protein